MGFLSGNSGPSEGEQQADKQLAQNQAELEDKKNSLYQTRLSIIKGQGAQDFGAKSPSIGGK